MFFAASITTEEIAPPVHVGEMGEVALVTDSGDRCGSFFYLYGFGFVLWESNRAKGGRGNEKREKDKDETFRG